MFIRKHILINCASCYHRTPNLMKKHRQVICFKVQLQSQGFSGISLKKKSYLFQSVTCIVECRHSSFDSQETVTHFIQNLSFAWKRVLFSDKCFVKYFVCGKCYFLLKNISISYFLLDFPGCSVVKNPPEMQEMQETQVRSLEEEMATHCGIS